ncbi:hypothetical protein F5X99DRAFT_386268 [Biscogniauxia marginata]|nr:hypothetical protein F5X99DRAFT_386268 [Biscogniauxia marginata]
MHIPNTHKSTMENNEFIRSLIVDCIHALVLTIPCLQIITLWQQRIREKYGATETELDWLVVITAFIFGLCLVRSAMIKVVHITTITATATVVANTNINTNAAIKKTNTKVHKGRDIANATLTSIFASIPYSLAMYCYCETAGEGAKNQSDSPFFLLTNVFYHILLWPWIACAIEYKFGAFYKLVDYLGSEFIEGAR